MGQLWASHILESPISWILSALYILATVVAGYTPLSLIVTVAAIGFGVGHLGVTGIAPASQKQAVNAAPEAYNTGRFAIVVHDPKLTFLEATVLVEPGTASPQNPAQLRDAILGLLTEAASLPLVQQADDTIAMLERSAMAMASETAPWLAGLDLSAVTE